MEAQSTKRKTVQSSDVQHRALQRATGVFVRMRVLLLLLCVYGVVCVHVCVYPCRLLLCVRGVVFTYAHTSLCVCHCTDQSMCAIYISMHVPFTYPVRTIK